jgi:hypothetical protein
MDEETAVQSIEDAFGAPVDMGNPSGELERLIEQVEKEVVAWRPNPGDKVFGILRDITDSSEGDFGSYPILQIETPNGILVGVHCFHTILRNEVTRKVAKGTLQLGDQIAILYVGQGVAQGGKNAPEMYRIAVARPPQI